MTKKASRSKINSIFFEPILNGEANGEQSFVHGLYIKMGYQICQFLG